MIKNLLRRNKQYGGETKTRGPNKQIVENNTTYHSALKLVKNKQPAIKVSSQVRTLVIHKGQE
jgi:hypothetical protein